MPNVITKEDHTYKHFNQAMGVKIESKKHYEHEMAKRGMVPYEKALELARKHDEKHGRKEYKLSAKAEDIIRSLKLTSRNGRVELGTRAINALEKLGLNFRREYTEFNLKDLNKSQGGFC